LHHFWRHFFASNHRNAFTIFTFYFVSLLLRFVEILPSKGAVERMCADFKVPMLPSIPMDPALVLACEQGRHLCNEAGVARTGACLALHQLTTSVM
jgi:hypothetical protein